MATIEIKGVSYELDEDGFLLDPNAWTKDVAEAFASDEGITEITQKHWDIIEYLRNYYAQFQVAPMVRKLCKETGVSLKVMYELFPSGPAKGACKLSGLPKPTGCV